MCRSRRELSNAYLLAKIGVDAAENEPLEVWGENSIHFSFASLVAQARKRASFLRSPEATFFFSWVPDEDSKSVQTELHRGTQRTIGGKRAYAERRACLSCPQLGPRRERKPARQRRAGPVERALADRKKNQTCTTFNKFLGRNRTIRQHFM